MTDTLDTHEVEYRQRLQRALGDDIELRDLIGRGGFGAVYAAWDRKLERNVAVKALRHDLFPTRLVLERFQREAKSVAKLRHAHILPVYSVGEAEGTAFMTMPLIKGESLATILRSGKKLPVKDALRITVEVARALEAAHRVGIVHRDVKPENILLEGDDRHALLADFGIAKVIEGEHNITGSGVVMGSPRYMSPEQASGERELDGRSDVYALGTVTYEMLAGHPPFEGASFQQQLVRQFTTDPTPIAELVPGLPAAVSSAVMRALERDREKRWPSAAEFAAALDAARSPGDTLAERPRDSWFARRGLLVALVLLLSFYLEITAIVLSSAGSGNASVQFVVSMFREPLAMVFRVALALLFLELVVGASLAWRAERSWLAALRAAFGQPRWWQAWYPPLLRDPDNAWDEMPFAMKLFRTIVWLNLLAIPLALPLIYLVPALQKVAASANLQLPLLMRITIAASQIAQAARLVYGLPLTLAGTVVIAVRRRVPVLTAIKLLFTWDRDRWSSTEARRLIG